MCMYCRTKNINFAKFVLLVAYILGLAGKMNFYLLYQIYGRFIVLFLSNAITFIKFVFQSVLMF